MSEASCVVSVEFIDAATGRVFARSDVPAGQLPDSFAPETTLQLGGDPWLVDRAEPSSAAEFVASGRLVLTVRRLLTVSPHDVLYSLPTICDALPVVGPAPAPVDCLEFHEDGWRQVELVSRSQAATVNTELDAIQIVYEQHGIRDSDGRVIGFNKIHVRPGDPLVESVSWQRLRGLFVPSSHAYGGVRFRGSAAVALGSFAFGVGPLVWYGLTARDNVTVLGLTFTADDRAISPEAIEPVLREFDLALVDWCRCAAIGPDRVADYLAGLDRTS
jgi:hypothetical protein